MSEKSSAIFMRMLNGEATSAEYVAAVRRETREALERDGFKPPRAPRRYQAEVDAVRHDLNKARNELRDVRAERRKLKAERDQLRQVAVEAARHLRNLPVSKESDDIRIAEALETAASAPEQHFDS